MAALKARLLTIRQRVAILIGAARERTQSGMKVKIHNKIGLKLWKIAKSKKS